VDSKTGKERSMKTVIVAGSRSFNDYTLMEDKLNRILSNWESQGEQITILQGGAQGADTLAQQYATVEGFGSITMRAEWSKYGRSAGMRRNEEMAALADAVIAFWDGESRGTAHMIKEAQSRKLPTRIIRF
jgi:hypothetical protein